MLSEQVDITVLMPVYNMETYIGEAIRSVLSQINASFELLIVNDGSTDNTLGVIESFSDPRIVLLHTQHGGVSHALNKGLIAAKGKYIARFDADDICLPGRLAKQFHFLEHHPDHVLVGSDAIYMMEDGEYLFDFTCYGHADEEIRAGLYDTCPVIHSAVMYRKDIVQQLGGYAMDAHNFEDYLLWVQVAQKGKLHNLDEPLIKVRFNPSSVTIDEKWRGKRFRQLKRQAISRGNITAEEGNELETIIRQQNIQSVKQGAYEALCGKKFLTDNYQPARARRHFKKNMVIAPLYPESYFLYMISFLPHGVIQWLHRRSRSKV